MQAPAPQHHQPCRREPKETSMKQERPERVRACPPHRIRFLQVRLSNSQNRQILGDSDHSRIMNLVVVEVKDAKSRKIDQKRSKESSFIWKRSVSQVEMM